MPARLLPACVDPMPTDKVFEEFDCLVDGSLGPSDIDEFLSFVRQSTERQLDRLDEEKRDLKPEQFENDFDLEEHLSILAYKVESVNGVMELADELSLLALMKKAEIRLFSILREKVPACAGAKKISFGDYRKALGDAAYDALTGKQEFRELLLVTNSIKHNGVVSHDLATEFPSWRHDTALTALDEVYLRLRDKMVEFVREYVTAIYAAYPRP